MAALALSSRWLSHKTRRSNGASYQEIERLAEAARAYAARIGRWVVLTLHASQSVEAQVSSLLASCVPLGYRCAPSGIRPRGYRYAPWGIAVPPGVSLCPLGYMLCAPWGISCAPSGIRPRGTLDRARQLGVKLLPSPLPLPCQGSRGAAVKSRRLARVHSCNVILNRIAQYSSLRVEARQLRRLSPAPPASAGARLRPAAARRAQAGARD